MIDILPAEVDQVVEDDGNRISVRILESSQWCIQGVAQRLRRIDRTNAVGNIEGYSSGNKGPYGYYRMFQRIHPDGLLPAQFIGIGGQDGSIPGDSVDELHAVQMGVYGMGVYPVVRYPPDLGPIPWITDQGPVCCTLEDLDGRGKEGVEHEVLSPGLGIREFKPQHSHHTPIISVEGFSHLILDGLRLKRQRHLCWAGKRLEGYELVILSYESIAWEICIVSGVVGRLRHDDLVLGCLKDTRLHSGRGKYVF
ncbi:MAG: hypothetical protein OEW23_14755 [Candidatus Aminicenantes bacterium]|nr:hypothetical protein [Candidatus Aminicenantes bacterium]